MTILYLLIPLALLLLGLAIWAFIWTIRSGQYDDMEGPAHRILMDDDDPLIPGNRAASGKPEHTDEPGT